MKLTNKNYNLKCNIGAACLGICDSSGTFVSTIKKMNEMSNENILRHLLKKERLAPCYLSFVKEYISSLDRTGQVVYSHFIKDIPKVTTRALLNLSFEQIDKILYTIEKDAEEFIKDFRFQNSHNVGSIIDFYTAVVSEDIPEEEIVDRFDISLATARICKVFANAKTA